MTLQEAKEFVKNRISQKQWNDIRERVTEGKETVDFIATVAHHGLGRLIRNELKLWHPESEKLRQEIWDAISEEERKHYALWWRDVGLAYEGRSMHADDASHELIRMVLKEYI